jgi:exopolyphosphatase/guanosine-5'-triphosphate,3'-diphosphate pyrophosphatase
MRVAAIDLGTNATRLLVADVDDGRVDEVQRRTRITRLGEGVDARRRLLPVPIARVRNVLTDYRREADALGAERVLAVATSAVRDAENGEAFLGEVEWSYGFATRLLTGDEEAAMTLRGVGPLEPGTLVVDIGGGSTELIMSGFHTSLDIGCVRLTERHGADHEAMAAEVRGLLPPLAPTRMMNVDGTTAELEHLYGAVTAAAIGRFLAEPPDPQRLLQPERIDVLAAGAVELREILGRYGLDRTEASDRDLLNGAALAAAELPAPEDGAAPPGAYTCC